MLDSSSSKLTSLQREFLHAFFDKTTRFFLTGGGALAAFYLHHRTTDDLDFFATPDVTLDEGIRALRAAAAAVEATAHQDVRSADFSRFTLERGDQRTLVDLVIDRAPQAFAEKNHFGTIVVDPMEEIAANKISALLSRNAARDLVDLKLLLETGLRIEDVLSYASRKDAGADAITFGWMLSQVRIPPSASLPGGMTAEALERFRQSLMDDLARLTFPKEE